MATTQINTSDLDIDTSRRLWHAHLPGRVVFGNGYTRPVQVIGNKARYTGLIPPSITGVDIQEHGGGVLSGKFKLALQLYNLETKERSLPAYYPDVITLDGGAFGSFYVELPIGFFDKVDPASHIEVYANPVDVGGWYLLESTLIANLSAGRFFFAGLDMDNDRLLSQRPLENQLQTSIFPAVDCASFWNGSLYGARLLGRLLPPTADIYFQGNSDTITFIGGLFRQSDRYKPIVRWDGQIVCFIWEPSKDGLTATIKLPGSTSDGPDKWTGSDQYMNVDEWGLKIGSEEQTIYVSSTYIGEAGNGITRGWVTWNPLNQLRDEYQVSVGSRITAMGKDRDNLAVFYDRAVVIYSGDPGLDVPTPRSVVVSEHIGSLAQHHVWNTRDGSLWWLTRNRVFTLSGGEVVDVTAAWGNASIFDKFFESEDASNFYNWNVAHNPTTNQSIIANMAEKDSADDPDTRAEQFGRSALLIDHSRQAFYRLQFPVRVKAISCVPRQDGKWSWFCAAVSATQPGEDSGVPVPAFFCTMFRDGTHDNVESITPIVWHAYPAMKRMGGHSIPVCERVLLEGEMPDNEAAAVYTTKGVAERSMIHGKTDNLFERDVTVKDVMTKDWIVYPRVKSGVGVQRRWSGVVDDNHPRVKLISAALVDDVVPLRGTE